ncbi:unnamed protein product [Cuscuta campestris]|uniref:Uncharacterized protein n=1 Tax=Cuscuta campestris TaxID=132261 RepID=A0A484NCA4_9ASTE|nr:unnamed protein product [Cuscuta campestris]
MVKEIPKPKFKKAFPRESRNQHAGGFNQADIPAAIAEEIVVFALVAPEVVAPHPMNLAVPENAVGHSVPPEPEPDSESEVEEDEVMRFPDLKPRELDWEQPHPLQPQTQNPVRVQEAHHGQQHFPEQPNSWGAVQPLQEQREQEQQFLQQLQLGYQPD